MRRLLLLPALLTLAACDGSVDDAFEETVVVQSYQVVGEPLARVELFRNAPSGGTFDRTALSVVGADVRVLLLAGDGSVERTYPYEPDPAVVGGYRAVDAGAAVLPLRRYRLEADVPGRDPIRAETVTPGTFEIAGASTDRAVWGGPEITLDVTRPDYPTRQAIFIFSTQTQRDSLSSDVATPFFRAAFESEQREAEEEDREPNFVPEDVRVGSSPPLNEGGYTANPDGTLRIELVWLAVPFYGLNRISASAVDDNLYDFVRSQSVQQGGGTLSPGEIPNVLDRVENGVGVFGSYSRVTTEVFVSCEPLLNLGACPADAQ